MKIDKKDLVKALKLTRFELDENESNAKDGWWILQSNSIKLKTLQEVLVNLPEETERKEEHKHKWQVLERTPMWDKNKGVYVGGFIFVCPCGAIKRVKEKGVEE